MFEVGVNKRIKVKFTDIEKKSSGGVCGRVQIQTPRYALAVFENLIPLLTPEAVTRGESH